MPQDLITEQEFDFVRRTKRRGCSGRAWTIDFHVRADRRNSLVNVRSTGNRATAQRASEHLLATWHDLNHLVVGPKGLIFVSLFDDTTDIWVDADYRLLEPLSLVMHWSRPDEFAATLRDGAC